jgi:hypothetical protein
MQRLLFGAGTFLLLAMSAYWFHARFGLSLGDALALVGLIGVAAALIPPARLFGGECHVSNVYVELGGQDWITFHFEAHVLNSGKELDVLKRVRYVFYHRQSGLFPLLLIFGAREIDRREGQILPCPLKPGQTYFVETKDSFDSDSPRGKRLTVEGNEYSDYTILCKFIFARSRSVTVRAHPHTLEPPDRFRSWLEEQRLRLTWDRTTTA